MVAGIAWFAAAITLQSALPEPPAMPQRTIAPRDSLPGKSIEIDDGDRKFTLFVPEGANKGKSVELTIHFHSAIWHAIQEHLDRGLDGPLIAFYPGEGSKVYQDSFSNPDRLPRWIEKVLFVLRGSGWPEDASVSSIDVTSFSAGYGAVRELVKLPKTFAILRRVVLADSMYGSLLQHVVGRFPLEEHYLVWKPLAEAAIRGAKTFAVTFSEVPTPTYASSSEMAAALVQSVGGKLEPVAPGSNPAASDAEFPLKQRFDKGRFHVWGYGGENAQAHMTHARHLADIWKALDKVGAP